MSTNVSFVSIFISPKGDNIVSSKKCKHFTNLFYSDLIKSTRLTGKCHVSLMWEFKPVRMKLNKRAEFSFTHTQSCDRNTSEAKRFPSDGASADSYAAHTRLK